jgi:ABC-type multidrug transport system fused ATPase/permease subunit
MIVNSKKYPLSDLYNQVKPFSETNLPYFVTTSSLMQVILSLIDVLSVFILGLATRLQLDSSFVFLLTIGQLDLRIANPESGSSSYLTSLWLILLSFLLFILKSFLSMVLTKHIIGKFTMLNYEMSTRILKGLLEISFSKLQRLKRSEINQVFSRGIEVLTVEIMGSAVIFVADFSLLLFLFSFLVFLDPGMAISLLAGFSILGGVLYFRYQSRARSCGAIAAEETINSEEDLNNTLALYRELFVSNELSLFENDFKDHRLNLAKSMKEIVAFQYISKYVLEVALVVCISIFAFYEYFNGDLRSLGYKIVIFAAAGVRLLPSILRLQQGFFQIKSKLGLVDRTVALMQLVSMDLPQKPLKEFDECLIQTELPAVEFRGVNFAHQEGAFTLTNLNCTIQNFSTVGVFGKSGSGKSTFVDLMLGLNTPQSGEIKIFGAEPGQVRTSKKSLISYVPQDTYLFNGTLLSNIMLNSEINSQSMDLVHLILQGLDMNDFIESLPLGLNTIVGPKGIQLSGGQRQRIGLARALLRQPRILVLDEVTSSLDPETSRAVMDSIKNFTKGKVTVIHISHKLESLTESDALIFFRDGSCNYFESYEEYISLTYGD